MDNVTVPSAGKGSEQSVADRKRKRKSRSEHKKLATLPKDARVTKRPLLHPPIPSPYTNSDQPKVVYISSRTPFISAVKRIENLLRISEKRLVQSATDQVRKQRNSGKGAKKGRAGDADEIAEIAAEVERLKTAANKALIHSAAASKGEMRVGEQVLVKGTGKAISKVLDIGLWFQERADVYRSVFRTNTVTAIDDIEMPDEETLTIEEEKEKVNDDKTGEDEHTQDVPESRMRHTNVLEIAVSLR